MTPFTLDANLVLSAGAGTGKTHSLMTLALHLLGGARHAGAVPPEKLCIVTFTEKAAAQLGERLRARVAALCAESQPEEPELRAAYDSLGQPFPAPAFWRGVLERLDRAQVGTFHGLCLRWLRPLVQRGLTESAELLDEETAGRLLQESVERAVLAQLERGNAQVAQLCRDLGYTSSSWAGGLVEAVARALLNAQEEGRPLAEIPVGDVSAARERLTSATREARQIVQAAGQADGPGKHRALLGSLEDALASVEATGEVAELDRLRREVGLAHVLKPVKQALGSLLQLHAAWRCAPLEGALRTLIQDSAERYGAELKARGLMDFASLLERVRSAWRDSPAARREAQSRVEALLVDEFQDTNQVQLELVTLLAEQREGGPRPLGPGVPVSSLPLQPRFLAIVGDRKQSIYEFRGADVSLFESLAVRMEQGGGQRLHLQTSYRSTPPLVAFFNQGFAAWMAQATDPRDYEVAFESGDVLEPARPPEDAAVARLLGRDPAESAHEDREAEARALARQLRQFLDTPGPDGRRPRGGEVAILLRRFSFLETYRQALLMAGVRHQVWRGRGFFTAPEVRDVEALLSWVCDPQDTLALVALLRSPFVGLTDGALWSLLQACGGKLSAAHLESLPALPASLAPQEGLALTRILDLGRRWRGERDTLDPRAFLESALDRTGYRTAAALGPYGDTILANLERLLERASRASARGQDLPTLAAELRTLMSSPSREPQAELQDGTDPDAVQLLTLHQSKGLEWPVVVVADLGGRRPGGSTRVVFERKEGLALRAGNGSVPGVVSARFLALQQELTRRQDAEELRLFYVAVTRARDRLWLSGLPAPRSSRTAPRGWAACTEGLRDVSLAAFCEEVPVLEAPGVEIAAEPPPLTPESVSRIRREVARVRAGRL